MIIFLSNFAKLLKGSRKRERMWRHFPLALLVRSEFRCLRIISYLLRGVQCVSPRKTFQVLPWKFAITSFSRLISCRPWIAQIGLAFHNSFAFEVYFKEPYLFEVNIDTVIACGDVFRCYSIPKNATSREIRSSNLSVTFDREHESSVTSDSDVSSQTCFIFKEFIKSNHCELGIKRVFVIGLRNAPTRAAAVCSSHLRHCVRLFVDIGEWQLSVWNPNLSDTHICSAPDFSTFLGGDCKSA